MPHKSNYTDMITLDLACADPQVTIRAKQFDNMIRSVNIALYDSRDGAYWYSKGGTAELRVQRPDGALITVGCPQTDIGSPGEEVTHYAARLTSDMLTIAGRARADIRVKMSDGSEISAGFIIEVIPSAHGLTGAGYVSDTVNIKKITAENYAVIPHSSNTLYIVTEQDGKVKQYLGDVEIGGGGSMPAFVSFSTASITAAVADATLIPELSQ